MIKQLIAQLIELLDVFLINYTKRNLFMKFICFLMVSGLLTSCSLSPNNDTKYSNNIRIIKEVPTQNTYSRTYNTKIEQVGYNSSIIKPELEQNNKEKKHNTNTYGNKVKHRVTNKLKNTTDNILDTTIDRGIDSLFR